MEIYQKILGKYELDEEFNMTEYSTIPEQISLENLQVLQEQSKNLRIMHLTTHSMPSTFNELLATIITLSETRSKDNPALLEYRYVAIPGFTTVFRNRESIIGCDVGAYIR